LGGSCASVGAMNACFNDCMSEHSACQSLTRYGCPLVSTFITLKMVSRGHLKFSRCVVTCVSRGAAGINFALPAPSTNARASRLRRTSSCVEPLSSWLCFCTEEVFHVQSSLTASRETHQGGRKSLAPWILQSTQ